MIKNYYSLIKPGIIYGNAITVAAGFFLASGGEVNGQLLIVTLLGIGLVMASGCVFNNYIDRDIDALMERTKSRVLVKGLVPLQNALIYGGILGILGTIILFLYTNLLTTLTALLGLFFYVVVYSLWAKRQSVYGTIIGSMAGAVPPVVGYLSVSNSIDLGAVLLFLILAIWQMPHSYAIAIYRLNDYSAAKIPVLPVQKGIRTTKFHIIFYILAFLLVTNLLHFYGYADPLYLIIISLLGLAWLGYSIAGFFTKNDITWSRNMFIFSLIIIVVFSTLISIDIL